jgi:hypothetical protein
MKYEWQKTLIEKHKNLNQIIVEYDSFSKIRNKNPKYSLAYVTLYLKILKFEKINFLILFRILIQFHDFKTLKTVSDLIKRKYVNKCDKVPMNIILNNLCTYNISKNIELSYFGLSTIISLLKNNKSNVSLFAKREGRLQFLAQNMLKFKKGNFISYMCILINVIVYTKHLYTLQLCKFGVIKSIFTIFKTIISEKETPCMNHAYKCSVILLKNIIKSNRKNEQNQQVIEEGGIDLLLSLINSKTHEKECVVQRDVWFIISELYKDNKTTPITPCLIKSMAICYHDAESLQYILATLRNIPDTKLNKRLLQKTLGRI